MNDPGRRDRWRKFFRGAAIAVVLLAGSCAYFHYTFISPQMALAKHRRTEVDLQNCSIALESYRGVHGAYPEGDWASVVRLLVDGQWLDEVLLRDHWNNPIIYEPSRKAGEPLATGFTLRSCGEDGVCESQLPSSVEFDPTDYRSDIVFQDGDTREW